MRISAVALGLMGMGFAVGCSSTSSDPFGPEPDFGKVESQFAAPSGTFAQGSEGMIISGLQQQKDSQAGGLGVGALPGGSGSGGTAGGVTSKALHFLDTQGGGTSFCAGLQSGAESGTCACPGGGALAYDLSGLRQLQGYQGGPIDVTLKVRANACVAQNASIDGTEFIKLKSNGAPSASDLMMLFDIHLSAHAGAVSARIDADFEYLNGKFWFSLGVNDGNVVVASATWDSSTKTGTIVVKDRSDTWTCDFVNGKGTCTSDHGGSRDVGL
jgi:hypothetical protein